MPTCSYCENDFAGTPERTVRVEYEDGTADEWHYCGTLCFSVDNRERDPEKTVADEEISASYEMK